MCKKALIPTIRVWSRTATRGASLAALALGAALLTLPAAPAAADSFYFGFSSGYAPRFPHGGRHYRHHDRDDYRYGFWRRHGHWRSGPSVIFLSPPVYYSPPPRVIYQAPAYVEPGSIRANPIGPTYRDSSGQLCREYQTTVNVGGRQRNAYGTACLQPDGDWRVVD